MLARRHRRRVDIKWALVYRLVLAGMTHTDRRLVQTAVFST